MFADPSAWVRCLAMPDRIELAPVPENVAAARRWSAERAVDAGQGHLVDIVSLLVSELVTNVVLHARTPFELSFRCRDHRLRVEVRDRSDRSPSRSIQSEPLAVSGRGMTMVSALSDACGSEQLPGGGKVVWFELGASLGANG